MGGSQGHKRPYYKCQKIELLRYDKRYECNDHHSRELHTTKERQAG
jgi:hypothetical protein